MNTQELGNRPAFPCGESSQYFGITYRQWLVGLAMQGYLAGGSGIEGVSFSDMAADSCTQADAILAREAQEAGDER